jgi:hypothetical protein
MERYRVYVGCIQEVNAKIKYSFCDPSMARMLVFAERKPVGDFRIMTNSEQETLSAKEKAWLTNSRYIVAMNNTSRTANEFARSMSQLMDALEEELKKEKEAMNDGEERTDKTE